jgi:ankyrin repeat protein
MSLSNSPKTVSKDEDKEAEQEILQIILFLEKNPAAAFSEKDINGNTLFHLSCCNKNHFLVTRKILDLNPSIDLNMKNNIGRTPLHFACMEDSSSCVELLIKSGANVNEVNRFLFLFSSFLKLFVIICLLY